jgi:hypothetical protein
VVCTLDDVEALVLARRPLVEVVAHLFAPRHAPRHDQQRLR